MDREAWIMAFVMNDKRIADNEVNECINYVIKKSSNIENVSDYVVKDFISEYIENKNKKKNYQYEDQMLEMIKQRKQNNYGQTINMINSLKNDKSYYVREEKNDKDIIIDYISKIMSRSGYHFYSVYNNDYSRIAKTVYFSYLTNEKEENILNGSQDLRIIDICFKMSEEYKNIINAIYFYLGEDKSLVVNRNRVILEEMILILTDLVFNDKEFNNYDRYDLYIVNKLKSNKKNYYHQVVEQVLLKYINHRRNGNVSSQKEPKESFNSLKNKKDIDWKKVGKGAALISAGIAFDMVIPIGYAVYKIVKDYKGNNLGYAEEEFQQPQGRNR